MAVVYMSPIALNSNSPANGEFPGSWLDLNPGNIDDPPLTPDDSDFAAFDPVTINNEFGADWVFGPAPTGLTNINVKLWLRSWDRSENGVSVDLRLWGYLRLAGVRYEHGTPADIIGTTGAQIYNPLWFGFNFPTNPATAGSWLLSDLVGLPGGSHFKVLTDPTGASTPYGKLGSAYLEITGDPITGNIEPIRSILSSTLRTFRKKKRYFDVHGRADLFDAAILGRLSVSHRNAPSPDGAGWGVEPWKRGNLLVLSSEVQADDTVTLHCMETEDWDTTLWTPLYTDITVSPADLSGIARVDLGGGWNHAATGMRNQLAYVPRPIDSLYNEVGANQWKVGEDGLHVESAGVVNLVLNASFSLGGPGNAFTSWIPVTGSGTGGSITEDLGDYLLDATNKRRSVKLVGGTTGETYLQQGMAITNVSARLLIWYKSDSGASGTRWRLQRSSDAKFWNDAAGTWDVADPINFLPNSGALPGEFYSKLITASGAVTYTLLVISAIAKVSHFYEAELLWDGGSVSTEVFSRTPLPTTSAAVTRVADLPYFGNDQGKLGWDPECGRAYFEFRPDWSHADLANGRTLTVMSAGILLPGTEIGTSFANDNIRYVRVDADNGKWIFNRSVMGLVGTTWYDTEVAVSSGAGTLPVRGIWHRFGARWASPLGEWGLGFRGLSLWIDPGNGVVLKATQAGNPVPDAQMVEWQGSGAGVANVTRHGWTLRKTSGADVTWNAASYSVQRLASGDGYIRCKVNDASKQFMFGFNSDPTNNTSYDTIDFAIYANAGELRVFENGTQKYVGAGEAGVNVLLSIEIAAGTVKYYSNGVLRYTAITPTITYPLYCDCSIFNSNAYIDRVVMAGTVAADGTRQLSGAVDPRLPQEAIGRIWPGTWGGNAAPATFGTGCGTIRKLDFSRRPGSDAALARLMKW